MKTKHPKLYTLGVCLLASLIGCLIIMTVSAGSRSISQSWFTLCGLLVIFAALGGYHFFDGRKPVARAQKLEYSALCSAVSGLNGWAVFKITTTNWETSAISIVKRGVASTQGASSHIAIGLLVGFAICYYGFRHLDDM